MTYHTIIHFDLNITHTKSNLNQRMYCIYNIEIKNYINHSPVNYWDIFLQGWCLLHHSPGCPLRLDIPPYKF